MRLKVILAGLILLLTSTAAQAQEAVGIQPPGALLGSALDQTEPETRVLSPDGALLAGFGTGGLCLYTFTPPAGGCFAAPFPWQPAHLLWSPDSRRIAFAPDVFGDFIEGDIWVFDVANRVFVNRTDDGIDAIGQPPTPGITLDYAPFWHPVSGELHFFRSESLPTQTGTLAWTLTLRRMPADTGDSTLLLDLSAQFPLFSVYESRLPLYLSSPAAVSPDGTRLALLVRGQDPDDARNGVWLLSLTDAASAARLTRVRLGGGLPGWQTTDNMFIDGLMWSRDGAGLVVATYDASLSSTVYSNLYYINVSNGDIVALLDFSNASQTDFFPLAADQMALSMFVPQGAVLHPTANELLLFGAVPGEIGPAALFSIALPPGQPPAVRALQQVNRAEGQPTQPSSAGVGRVFIGGYLFPLGG